MFSSIKLFWNKKKSSVYLELYNNNNFYIPNNIQKIYYPYCRDILLNMRAFSESVHRASLPYETAFLHQLTADVFGLAQFLRS